MELMDFVVILATLHLIWGSITLFGIYHLVMRIDNFLEGDER